MPRAYRHSHQDKNSFAAPLTSAPIELSLDILLIKSIKKTFKSPSTPFITLFNIQTV
ncbi:hypothetical protein BGLA2_1330011 [Burkholderia gladioli]|nr:hypothetical protein BGLA2_1330011 [Burkholderia gladioli]